MPSISVKDSLQNSQWVAENYEFLRSCFPEEYIQVNNELTLRLGWKLKLHGVEWREITDIANFLGKYHHSRIFDAIINPSLGKALIRRFPVVQGIEPVFVLPKSERVAVPAAPPASSKDDVIDVEARERHEGAATKLIERVRGWVK